MLKIILIVSFIVILSNTMAQQLNAEEQWQQFKQTHNKSYSTEEEERRLGIFKENLQKINEHNAKYEKGEVTYTMGINAFTDLTPEEFKSRFTGGIRAPPPQQ